MKIPTIVSDKIFETLGTFTNVCEITGIILNDAQQRMADGSLTGDVQSSIDIFGFKREDIADLSMFYMRIAAKTDSIMYKLTEYI